jgi:hypothetical protein
VGNHPLGLDLPDWRARIHFPATDGRGDQSDA